MPTTIKDIKDFFGYSTLSEFSVDWKALSDRDKEQIRGGIDDGSFDYVA
jgi:hypothetical protein